ncbi:hypothetical protein LHP98_10755 [Rhodobacter sp. Har01]|uniref:hypothetical protein n=1 Tax=Rhodobacter sp. Har01 TaxID=2883999 RepID=UPI001D07EC8C|nr:hypothetical protein [Rhodobacter sp. Har01]MCB6178608.1 hypothetical protein [Rhodobacter sp. Har01]
MGSPLNAMGRSARRVASALIAGITRRHKAEEVEAWIAALAPREQAGVVLATLAALFLLSLVFAQAGVVGMLAFLLLVILVVN